MIRKNGAPYQTLTRMTENRAQYGSLSQAISWPPKRWMSQLNALWVGSNSHHQLRVESASGMTHGTSSMPRHLRWPLLGRLLTRCAVISPISALKNTAVMAKIADCWTTIQNTSRLSRNVKFAKPTNRVWALLSVERNIEYSAG